MQGSHGRISSKKAVIDEVYHGKTLDTRVCCAFCRNQHYLRGKARDESKTRRVKAPHKVWGYDAPDIQGAEYANGFTFSMVSSDNPSQKDILSFSRELRRTLECHRNWCINKIK